jgi:ribonuclease BN (tRNA processing enzyme)
VPGDEPFNEANLDYAFKPDWLLSEAMCLYSEREIYRPYAKFHSTVLDAARLAQRLKAKNLVLYHTVDNRLSERKERSPRRPRPSSAAAFSRRTIWRRSGFNKGPRKNRVQPGRLYLFRLYARKYT